MTTHTVAQGESWSVIAAQHDYRNWRIVYYAPENADLRRTRPNPDLLQPGDKIVIPDRSRVAFIDAKTHVEYNNVPLFTQAELTCWKACGKMTYLWKYPSAAGAFEQAAGNYRTLERGLRGVSEWVDFYSHHLGMLGTEVRNWNFLFNIVATRGPAVVEKYTTNIDDGHAMVLSGYDLKRGTLFLLDPAAGEAFVFDEQGNATFSPGSATRANMGRWHDIAQINLRMEVFHW